MQLQALLFYFLLLTIRIFDLGGSLFLFDRKVLRYFRKDGHNWRKKKDGKTVKEAHERLKVSEILEFFPLKIIIFIQQALKAKSHKK